jgi:AsmA protein
MYQIARKFRYVLGLLGGIATALLIAAAALPFLVDAEAVRDNLTRSLSAWTGGPVTISGPLRIAGFTDLSVEAEGVRLIAAPRLEPLKRAEAESVTAVIRLSSLLRGGIEFKKIVVASPRFVFNRRLPAAERVIPGLETVGAAIAISARSAFDKIELIDPVFFTAEGDRKPYRRASLEEIDLAMVTPADASSPATMTIHARSPGVRAYFRGECDPAGLTAHGAFRLVVSLNEAPAKAAMARLAPWERAGGVDLSGDLNWSRDRVALERATIAFADHSASGSVALNLSNRRPLLEGTLAYDMLDLTPAWLAAAEAGGKAQARPLAALPFASRDSDRALDFDMRISADRLRAGSFETGPLALALTATKDKVSVDVAEVSLFGGKAAAKLEVEPSQPVALSISGGGWQFDPRALAEALQLPRGVSGPVTARFALAMPLTGNAPADDMRAAQGSFSVRFPSGGALEGDMARVLGDALATRDLEWGFGETSLPFAAATIDGTVKQGGITLQIDGEAGSKSIGGSLKLAFPGAAVSGSLSTKRSAGASGWFTDTVGDTTVHLVLSGTPDALVFSPLGKAGVPN